MSEQPSKVIQSSYGNGEENGKAFQTDQRYKTTSTVHTFFHNLFRRQPIDRLIQEADMSGMKRNLNAFHLVFLGIGAIIGAGIFVYSGIVAANNAGPAVVLCFIIAGVCASLSALSYSELAACLPISGSSYTFTYASMGEFLAWFIGWLLVLEYLVGTAAITVGWSGYLVAFFKQAANVTLNPDLVSAPVVWSEEQQAFLTTGHYFNLPAMLILLILTILLTIGTKESATVTAAAVVIKVSIIIVFIAACASYVDTSLWSPFIPDQEDGIYGKYGATGVLKGSSIVFFSYVGFDAVSTMAQEAKNPGRDMPIGIIGSLTVSTALYIGVCLVMVGLVPFKELNVAEPISVAIEKTGMIWLAAVIDFSAVVGILTTIMVTMLGQSRIFYSMARDGLLPGSFSRIHPKFGTPYIAQICIGLLTAILAGVLPVDVLGELSGVGTLAAFTLVNLSVVVLRHSHPHLVRPFKVPLGPYFIPILGALVSLALVVASSPATLIRLAVWVLIGFVIYFLYGYRKSKLRSCNLREQPNVEAMQMS